MERRVTLFEMFSNYEPPEEIANLFAQAAVVAADIHPENRSVAVAIYSDNYISAEAVETVRRQIAQCYGLSKLIIEPTYPASQLERIPGEDLMDLFVAENPLTRGSLAGAQWLWEGENLTIQLPANGKDSVLECVSAVKRKLDSMFAANVSIDVKQGKELSGKALYDALEEMRRKMLEQIPKVEVAVKPEQATQSAPQTVYGKPFKGNPTPMKDLNLDMGSVIVEGKVFAVDHKELKKRNAALRSERAALLEENGYPADYTEVKYQCEKCVVSVGRSGSKWMEQVCRESV